MTAGADLAPALFLDRDGTINVEKNYLYRFEDWEWIPGAIDAIRRIGRAGWRLVVVTNQAGVARGLYGESDVLELHARVDQVLRSQDARVDAYYFCPHHPEYGNFTDCGCRKPRPGMLLRAAAEHGIDLGRSWLVGDRESDIGAALSCGVTPILVGTGYGPQSRSRVPKDVTYLPSLREAVDHVLRTEWSLDGRGD